MDQCFTMVKQCFTMVKHRFTTIQHCSTKITLISSEKLCFSGKTLFHGVKLCFTLVKHCFTMVKHSFTMVKQCFTKFTHLACHIRIHTYFSFCGLFLFNCFLFIYIGLIPLVSGICVVHYYTWLIAKHSSVQLPIFTTGF